MDEEEETLEDILNNMLASMSEVQSVAVVSIEGLPIASVLHPNTDETKISAITAAILTLAEIATQEFGKGFFEQVFVRGQYGYVFTMAVGHNAVLTISTTRDIKLGLIFIETKQFCDKIAKYLKKEEDLYS